MIEATGISKFYGSFKALDDVSFSVARGEVLGFLGPNGAGKSTTMKVLTTFISASEGSASIEGFDVHANPQDVRKRIGYLPETPPLYGDMTVDGYLDFAGRARGLSGDELKRRKGEVIERTMLAPKLKNAINELSKGYRQRVGLAQALIHDPPALILDEPTSGLDPSQIIGIRRLIADLKQANKAVIFSTHILQEAAAVASRLVIINNGKKVADGTVDELAAKAPDGNTVKVLVRGNLPQLAEMLRGIANVSRVVMQAAPEGYARYFVTVASGGNVQRTVAEDIARVVVRSGLALTEIAPETVSLETIFLRLLAQATDKAKPPDYQALPEQPTPRSGAASKDPESTHSGTRMTKRPTEGDVYEGQHPPTETAIAGLADDVAEVPVQAKLTEAPIKAELPGDDDEEDS